MISRKELQFQVQLDKLHALDLDKDLSVDRTKINDEMGEQPGMFAWYAVLSELARHKAKTCRRQLKSKEGGLKTLYAELSLKTRQSAVEQNIKTTEGSIDSVVRTLEPYKKAEREYDLEEQKCIDVERDAALLYVAKEAFEERLDMLISIGANMRKEGDDDLKILKDKVREKIDTVKRNATHP